MPPKPSPKTPRKPPIAVLYCAGRRGSLDEAFYRWVLRGRRVQVRSVGGHRDVVRILGQPPQAGEPPNRAGVVDRDAWPHDVLVRQSVTVEVLPYFEVESYLVHPELLAPAMRVRGRDVSAHELIDQLLEAARATYMPAINAHLSHAPKAKGRGRLEQMAQQYADQLRKADAIIESGNVDALLRYFPGRRLAQRMAKELDFLNAQHLLDSILQAPDLRNHCRPIKDLREALMLRLGV